MPEVDGLRLSDLERARVAVVAPTWVGDAIMATPALRRVRDELPRAEITLIARPGAAGVLGATKESFSPLADRVVVSPRRGLGGLWREAALLRDDGPDAVLLLQNSFASAATAWMGGAPVRIGYERDGRGVLLTRGLTMPRRGDGPRAIVPAVDLYWHAAGALLAWPGEPESALSAANAAGDHRLPGGVAMELPIGPEDERAASAVRERVGVDGPYAVLNPGGNNPAKRWPAERFGELAARLGAELGLSATVNGSPAEAGVVDAVVRASGGLAKSLPAAGGSIGALKALVRDAALLVTNDTGPRHMAAATRTPVVTLFGPTDHRWTSIPTPGGEAIVTADPTLPADESANDHPERCRVDRIEPDRVWRAVRDVLGS